MCQYLGQSSASKASCARPTFFTAKHLGRKKRKSTLYTLHHCYVCYAFMGKAAICTQVLYIEAVIEGDVTASEESPPSSLSIMNDG